MSQAPEFTSILNVPLKLDKAGGTVRRFLAEHAAEITGNVVWFADGSAIERADVLLAEAR